MTTEYNAEKLLEAVRNNFWGLTVEQRDALVETLKQAGYRESDEQRREDALKSARDQASCQMESITKMVAALQCDYDRLEELRDQRVPRFVAGWNMPGYMPDSEPAEFDDADDALEYLKDTAKQFAEQDADGMGWSDADLNAALKEIDTWTADSTGAFGLTQGNFHYWVTQDGTMGLDADELKELEELEAAAGDCNSEDQARQRIQEDPLSIEVRSDWSAPGGPYEMCEFQILLCTGGPAVRIVGELDSNLQPCRAWIEYQDWFTKWEQLMDDDQDALLAYCSVFYFGE